MTKRCSDCAFECPIGEAERYFYPRRAGRGWLESRCKECSKRRGREWAARNRERKREGDQRRRLARLADPEYAALDTERKRDYARTRRLSRRADATPGQRVAPEERRRLRVTSDPVGMVPSAPIRAAIERSGLGLTEIAARAGYRHEGSVRHVFEREQVTALKARRILAAIDVLPVEVGL